MCVVGRWSLVVKKSYQRIFSRGTQHVTVSYLRTTPSLITHTAINQMGHSKVQSVRLMWGGAAFKRVELRECCKQVVISLRINEEDLLVFDIVAGIPFHFIQTASNHSVAIYTDRVTLLLMQYM